MNIVDFLSLVVQQLEGPYKWYVIGLVALLLTAGITRYIFKTFKWMLLVLIIGTLGLGLFWSVVTYTNLI